MLTDDDVIGRDSPILRSVGSEGRVLSDSEGVLQNLTNDSIELNISF